MDNYRRHKAFYGVLKRLVAPFFKSIYRYEYKVERGPQAPFIVLANHNMNVDPILLGMSFRQHMYFVASEHIYRWGLVSKLIIWLFAPIARLKGSTDARTAMEIMRQVRKGRNIGIFAEGNRSYNGVTGPIPPATGKLIKAAGGTMVTFKFEGGYFTEPRWAAKKRRGRMRGYVVNTYSPETLQTMSAAEIQAVIEKDLHEDACARQRQQRISFRGKRLAEWLEAALYVCPCCEEIGRLHSEGDSFACECGMRARYTVYGDLEGDALPFSTIAEWDAWQRQQLRQQAQSNAFALRDTGQQLRRILAEKGSELAGEGDLQMDRHAITCGNSSIPIEEISDMAIVSRMTIVFTTKGGEAYEVVSEKPRSAEKYMAYYEYLKEVG